MSEYERELFDEFKRLEALCRDMFSCQHGVSEYISQMEQTPARIQYQIPSWDKDYRTLKHLRWLRNKIVHETTATDCNLSDIEQLKDFYRRILNGQDPLAAARRVSQKLQNPSCQQFTAAQKDIFHLDHKQLRKPAHRFPYRYLSLCLLAILIVIVILLFHLVIRIP